MQAFIHHWQAKIEAQNAQVRIACASLLHPGWMAWTHVLSQGLHYGESCLKRICAYGGRPFALEAHLDRFFRSAKILGMSLR